MSTTSQAMKPMHLPGVEQNPQPSAYADLIHSAQKSGGEYWKIWHLFAFRPEMAAHLEFHPLRDARARAHEPKLRELIAAYTSRLNDCEFCMKSHIAIAGELYGDENFVRAVLNDPDSSGLPDKEKALLRFSRK